MPRNASGTYSLPSGNPVVSGTLIEADWANTTLNDIANELTDSLSRSGEGGMLAPFRLADGLQASPGIAWLNEPSTGFYREGSGEMWGVVGGAQILQYTATGVLVPTGKTLTANGGITATTLTTSGAATLASASVTGNLSVGGTLTLTGGLTLNGNVTVGDSSADTLTINSTITSHLLFTDNTYDIGASGATRPRNLYLAGDGVIGGTLGVTGVLTASGGVTGNLTGNVTGNVTGNISGGTVAGSTGTFSSNVTVGGTLGVTGAATLSNTLAVTGAITATGGVLGNVTGDLTGNVTGSISGGTVAGSTGAFSSNVTVGGTLGVTGVTTLTVNPVLSAGTANGVLYLNGSKEATSGSVITYDGTTFGVDDAVVINESGGDNDTRIEGDTDANLFFVDASTDRIGVGTNAPAAKLDVNGTLRVGTATSIGATAQFGNTGNVITFIDSGATGVVGVSGANPLTFYTNGAERLRIDSAGNLGLGVTPSAWYSGYTAQQLGASASIFGNKTTADTNITSLANNAFLNSSTNWIYINTDEATRYSQVNGQHQFSTAPSGTAGNTITFTQAMTLTSDSKLLVGTTDTAFASGVGAHISNSASADTRLRITNAGTGTGQFDGFDLVVTNAGQVNLVGWENQPMTFLTNATERARITSGGIFGVGVAPTGSLGDGFGFQCAPTVGAIISRDDNPPLLVNRGTSDGTIISIRQATVEEGTISVSGNTVSYNAFAGSHWSQLQDGSKPDILRGTVMESINELCEWPNEENERLPKCKISDTAGSKKVYGVFMAWDNDWETTNDMYVTAVGAFVCRVNSNVTVQEGDLLESNGDGTARVQADDLIRSSTIGKVTSTVKTHQYDDGSYCVPTVLYCG